MKSRYDYMTESNVIDTDGETWPDPLSTRFNNTKFTTLYTTHTITSGDISKFWLYYYRRYGTVEMDDVLLTLNSIPYIGTLEPGDEIAEIADIDLVNFDKQPLDE